MHCRLCCMCVFCETVRVRGCSNAGVGSGGGVVAVSAYMDGTRGSGVLIIIIINVAYTPRI